MNTELEIRNHPYVIELENVIRNLQLQATKTTESFHCRIGELETQLSWFQRQLFGKKSERRAEDIFPVTGTQLSLIDVPAATGPAAVATTSIKEHSRKKSNKVALENNASESGLRFGPEVRIEEVVIPNPVTEGLQESEYTVIDEVVTDRLCQEKGSYYVKRFRRKVIKVTSTAELRQDPAPERVIDSAQADLTLLLGLVIDKFLYHLPLYRQHQRMKAQGIQVSRASLTNWVLQFIALFEPIYRAQQESILQGKIISMDETPHKAGRRDGNSQMSNCYYWFVYGEQKEVFIHSAVSRGAEVVKKLLFNKFHGTLLSDGYVVYDSIVKELNLVHANCWAHVRRYFVEAEEQEPQSCKDAVNLIRTLYEKEEQAPPGREERLEYRLLHEKLIVEQFFEWLRKEELRLQGLPKTSYSKAVNYALAREASLKVFLSNPDVPVDNNHTERQIRPLVLGRKNYLFCWSELGAEKVAIIQSLLLTCQLHEIDPWDYLSDVAQRISTHPMSKVSELIPRNWKNLFKKTAQAQQ